MKSAVIFDLGNTLVSYYTRAEWADILARSIAEARDYLSGRGLLRVDGDELEQRVGAERAEPPDHRVRPLEGRLAGIFKLTDGELADGTEMELCRRFMIPTFASSRRYDDTLPTLETLRARGLRTAILSNTPWGSPAELWREEVDRHSLTGAVDMVVFCRDVGYRKPAPHGFLHIAEALGLPAEECLFVGDDPRWDIVGPRGVGMDAILIDRSAGANGTSQDVPLDHEPITDLAALLDRL